MPAPNNPTIMVAMVCMIFSIAFFNFFGISVTKKMSAAHRMVLDSVRTIIVWIVGLGAFGEKFSILQFVGFLILISGTLVYNVIFRVPTFDYTAFDSPDAEPPVLAGRKKINAAITDRDYLRADKVQNDLANLGDQRYVQRNIRFGSSGAGGSIQEPLLGSDVHRID